MPIRLITTTCSASTSAGNCKKIEAGVYTTVFGTSNYDDVNTARTAVTAVSVTTGVALTGAYLPLKRSGTTGTFTVALLENGTQVSVSGSLNVSSLNNGTGFYYLTWSSPYTALAGKTYSIKIVATNSAQLFWWRSATASDYGYSIVGNGDNTTGYTSGDTLFLQQGITFTVDQSITLAAASTGTFSLLVGDSATLNIPNPSSAITVNLGAGRMVSLSNTMYTFGSIGTPIQAGYLTITTSSATVFETGYISFLSTNAVYTSTLKFYGNKPSTFYVTLASDASSGQAVCATTGSIPSSWVNGDTAVVVGKDTAALNAIDNNSYTITKGTNQITLSANLASKAFAGGVICNRTESKRQCGIAIISTGAGINCLMGIGGSPTATFGSIIFSGVYFENMGSGAIYDIGATGNGMFQMDSVYWNYVALTNVSVIWQCNIFTGNNINNVVIDTTYSYAGYQFNLNNSTVNGLVCRMICGVYSATTNYGIYGNAIVINNSVFTGQTNLTYSHNLVGSSITVNNCFYDGSIRLTGGPITLNNVNIYNQAASAPGHLQLFNASSVVCNNCNFGTDGASVGTREVVVPVANYGQILINNCNIGSKGVYAIGAVAGSLIECHNYNSTVGDHRSWTDLGYFYTTSGSGYTNLVEEAQQSTSSVTHQYSLLTQTVASQTLYLVATGQVSSAYYAGVHTAPKIAIYSDGNLITPNQTLSLSDSNSTAQTVAQTFTPTTSNNNIVLDFLTKTDATGTNADCAWSNVILRNRQWTYLFVDYLLGISETFTYPIATIQNRVVNSFITQTTQSTVDAYTGIAIDGSGNITLTANHSINEVYDFVQSYCSKSANILLNVPLTTADGSNFVMSANMTINGCTLTGTASQVLVMGSNTLTLSGGGVAQIVYSLSGAKSSVLVLNVASGSSVLVKNQLGATYSVTSSSGTQVIATVAPSTTGSYSYKVAKYGGLPTPGSFVVTSGGYQTATISLGTDTGITQATAATVAAYTTLETTEKLYDYSAYYETTTTGILVARLLTKIGSAADAGSDNITIDATAASVWYYDGTGVNATIKASTFTTSPSGTNFNKLQTSGNINLANGAVIQGVVTSSAGTTGVLSLTFLSGSSYWVKDQTGSIVANTTGSSATFYIAAGVTGSYSFKAAKYNYISSSGSTVVTGGGYMIGAISSLSGDTGITQATVGTVAAYTTLENEDKLYDYAAYFETTSSGITYARLASKVVMTANCGSANITLQNSGSVFAWNGTTATVNASSTFGDGSTMNVLSTSGTVTYSGTVNHSIITDSTGTTGILTFTVPSGSSVAVYNQAMVRQQYIASSGTTVVQYVPPGITGSYTFRVAKYGYVLQSIPVTVTGGVRFSQTITLIPNTGITQATVATVAAYTTLETLDKIFDYLQYNATTSTGIDLGDICLKNGVQIDVSAGGYTLAGNPFIHSAVVISGSTITVRSVYPWTDALIAYWNLNETSGTRVDASGNGHSLTEIATTGYTAGKVGNAVQATNAGKYLYDATNTIMNPAARPSSYTFWMKTTVSGNFFGTDDGAGNNYFIIGSTNTGISYIVGGGGGTFGNLTFVNTMDGVWHFFIINVDSSGTMSVSVDGSAFQSVSLAVLAGTTGRFMIGGNWQSGNYYPDNFAFDEYGYWNRPLTLTEAQYLYNSGGGTTYPFQT